MSMFRQLVVGVVDWRGHGPCGGKFQCARAQGSFPYIRDHGGPCTFTIHIYRDHSQTR